MKNFRNIIICLDGTGNEYCRTNTNVVKTYAAVADTINQMPYYDPGVGTFNPLGLNLGRISKKTGKILGQAFGYGVIQNVKEAYIYLMDHFEEGDNIYIFGFSRGAHTARVLAGMINRCGLLKRGSQNLLDLAIKLNFDEKDSDVVLGFKNGFCRTCKPHFLGVWDTVASLGNLHPAKHFKDDVLNHDIPYAYHAISIDETRKKFPVSVWDESKKNNEQIIEQVWFPGVHSDIGGSYKETELSDITLHWMLRKAEDSGLILKNGWNKGLNLNPLGPIHESRVGLWRIWPATKRIIPEEALIHESVFERMDMSDYQVQLPSNYQRVSYK